MFNNFYFLESPGNWYENRVDLKAFEGQTVKIKLEATSDENGLAIWGDPVILQKKGEKEWNVLLISLDTLRADHLGSYDYAQPITPEIDRMAQRGTRFHNAIAQAPWTTPSHQSLLTGYYPSSLGYNWTPLKNYLTAHSSKGRYPA